VIITPWLFYCLRILLMVYYTFGFFGVLAAMVGWFILSDRITDNLGNRPSVGNR
jgi:hypothetical protein